MKLTRTILLATCLTSTLALPTLTGCNKSKDTAAAKEPLTISESINVTLTATVLAIDVHTREITLEDDQGNKSTFVLGPEIRRVNEIFPGDRVRAEYTATLLAELRAPTPEEAAAPAVLLDASGRAGFDQRPGAASALGARVVTTVTAIDLPNLRVTLRGPMGDSAVVQGRKPENVKRLKVGDTIIITYTQAIGVKLEKMPK